MPPSFRREEGLACIVHVLAGDEQQDYRKRIIVLLVRAEGTAGPGARWQPMSSSRIRGVLTKIGVLAAHPAAFLIVVVYTAAWIAIEPETFDWHGVATIATWMMTLFIQRAEHRDTQAIHAKLDELLKAEDGARTNLKDVDQNEPEEIEEERKGAKA